VECDAVTLASWEGIASVLDEEPVREVDKIMMAMSRPLGIEKGRPFPQSEREQRILIEGAALGELMVRNLQVNPRYTSPYWGNTQWFKSVDFDTSQEIESMLQLDQRVTWFYEAVTSSKGMINPDRRRRAGLYDQQTSLRRSTPPRRSCLQAPRACARTSGAVLVPHPV
jgi:hypothetical protein